MASDADKTMSETEPRRSRRRPTAEAGSAGKNEDSRPRRRKTKPEDTSEETAVTVGKGYATPGRRQAEEEEEKQQGGNVITRTVYGLRDYFEGVRGELTKVTWPSTEDLRRLSLIVLATLVASAVTLGLISFTFTELFRAGLSNPIILIVFMVIALGVGVLIARSDIGQSSS